MRFRGLPLFYEKGQAGETPHSAEFLFYLGKKQVQSFSLLLYRSFISAA